MRGPLKKLLQKVLIFLNHLSQVTYLTPPWTPQSQAPQPIAFNAPIAELSIAAPERLVAFKDQPTRRQKFVVLPIQLQHSGKKKESCCLLVKEITDFSRAVDMDVLFVLLNL